MRSDVVRRFVVLKKFRRFEKKRRYNEQNIITYITFTKFAYNTLYINAYIMINLYRYTNKMIIPNFV